MRVHIQAVDFTASEKLIQFTEEKLAKLEQYFDRISDAEVFLRLDSKSSHIKDKVARVKINIPGKQLVAAESSKVFEQAVDLAVDSLRRQLKKIKEKMRGQ